MTDYPPNEQSESWELPSQQQSFQINTQSQSPQQQTRQHTQQDTQQPQSQQQQEDQQDQFMTGMVNQTHSDQQSSSEQIADLFHYPPHTFPDLQQNEQSGIEWRLDQQGTQIQQIQQMMHSLVQQRQQSPAPSPPQQHQQEQEQQGQQEHVFRQSNQIKSSKNWRN